MEKEVLIFGHKVPDTDSIMASITLSYLKQQLGVNAIPRAIGYLNKESKFILDYFNVEAPSYLNDVKSKIKHTKFQKNHIIGNNTCILECFEYMEKMKVRTLPVVNDENEFIGLISMNDIASYLINSDTSYLKADFDDIIYATKSKTIIKIDEQVEGKVVIASYDINKILAENLLNEETILVVGNRVKVIDYAIGVGVKMLVLTGETNLNENQINIATKKKINVINTSLDTYTTSNKIILANLIEQYINNNDISTVSYNMYIDDFISLAKEKKYKNYPVIGKNNKCLGLVNMVHVFNVEKKDVILVDHNELSQSADGIKEANIIEVVDHHHIGSITTANPISFTTMPVGCTNTIIYYMYKENNIEIPKHIAGLMASAIISDTLHLKSPTTTDKDKKVLKELVEYINLDEESYVNEMFKAGTSLKGMSIDEIINIDIKEVEINNNKVTCGQVMTMDIDAILNNKEAYIERLNVMAEEKKYDFVGLFITDIVNESSYVLYSDNSYSILKSAFNLYELHQGLLLKGVVSRKKQIIPNLIYTLDK